MSEKQQRHQGFERANRRHFTEWFGDTLQVDDPPVEGSVFTLFIPAMVSEVLKIRSSVDTSGALASSDSPRYSPMNLKARILVAEDQRENQKIIAVRLNLAGAEVTIVPNGLEAVNAVIEANDSGSPFDLVLMDMQMPVLDGYGATKELRDRGFDRLPIIALTAHALPEDREECLRYGCDDHVTKPIPWNTLYEALADLLNRASAPVFSMRR